MTTEWIVETVLIMVFMILEGIVCWVMGYEYRKGEEKSQ
jgi:hypothetical protein